MKSVLLSIKPKWCELIANGQKTIEIRKTRPKIDTPFKVYIYCTKDKMNRTHEKYLHTSNKVGVLLGWDNPNDCDITVQPENYTYKAYSCVGKVIGEFVCNEIIFLGNITTDEWKYLVGDKHEYHKKLVTECACLSEIEVLKYGNQKSCYAWCISNLKIYDKPKDWDEFEKPCSRECECCKYYSYATFDEPPTCEWNDYYLTRPPQSWCYVEELE